MADERELFDQRIFEAYEGIEPSEEAQERMLANLLAAQSRARQAEGEQTQVTEAPVTAVPGAAEGRAQESERHQAAQVLVPRRRSPWRVVLPLAAALALVAVVVRVTNVGPGGSRQDAVEAASTEMAAEPKANGMTEDVALSDEAEAVTDVLQVETPLSEGADLDAGYTEEFSADERTVDACPCIRLGDGSQLTALRDGVTVDEVESERVGELLGIGTAVAFDAPSDEAGVPCEVFRLLDEDDVFAVRYEGEQTFWRCTRTE